MGAGVDKPFQVPDKNHFKIKRSIIIEPDLYYSDAFKTLSASAIRVLLRCLQKRTWARVRQNGGRKRTVYTNNGFIFPYVEGASLGIKTTQFWKNIKTLVEVGFLDIEHYGGWYQKYENQKDYTIYKLSNRWRLYGTKEFREVKKERLLQPDFYIQKNIAKKLRATSQTRSQQLHHSEVDNINKRNNRLHHSEVDRKEDKASLKLVNTRIYYDDL